MAFCNSWQRHSAPWTYDAPNKAKSQMQGIGKNVPSQKRRCTMGVRLFRTYCTLCGVIVSIVLVIHCIRIANRVPSEVNSNWYAQLNGATKLTIQDCQNGRSLTFDTSDRCWNLLINGLRRPLFGPPSFWSKFNGPSWLDITLYDEKGDICLQIESDGKHLKCDNYVFDTQLSFHLLFRDRNNADKGLIQH